jgi:hypothetical protein
VVSRQRLFRPETEGLLVDRPHRVCVLDQVVAERGDVVADELQDPLACCGAFLEEVDDPGEQASVRQLDRPDLEQILLHLMKPVRGGTSTSVQFQAVCGEGLAALR